MPDPNDPNLTPASGTPYTSTTGAFVSNGALPPNGVRDLDIADQNAANAGPQGALGTAAGAGSAGQGQAAPGPSQMGISPGKKPNPMQQQVEKQASHIGDSMISAASAMSAIQDKMNAIFGTTQQVAAEHTQQQVTQPTQGTVGGQLAQKNSTFSQIPVQAPPAPPPLVSDRRAKTNIKSGDRPIRKFLNALNKGNTQW